MSQRSTRSPAGPSSTPPFEPADLPRQLRRGLTIRLAIGIAVGLAVFVLMVLLPAYTPADPGTGLLLAALLIMGVWLTRAVANAKAAGAARGLMVAINATPQPPPGLEARLDAWLEKPALIEWVRLMLHAARATLYHRRGQHAQAAALAGSILQHPLGPAEGDRPHLLLLLAEASLEANEPWGAYTALLQLHASPLTLQQSLQRLGLQTRYEVSLAADDQALHHWPRKTQLAELMPGPLCGATHAMLALAAQRTGHPADAAWLRRRAELLCEPTQLQQLQSVGLAPRPIHHLA